MRSIVPQALGGAGLVLSFAVATASPVLLDTEQKAAAGVATALFKSDVPRSLNAVIGDARDYAAFTLKTVSAAITPEELIAAQGPVTIPCISGSLDARMADVLPRVLRVRWNDCLTNIRTLDKTLNGPVAITLPSDTFQPQSVLAIRLGNDAGEFLQQWRFEMPDQKDDTTLAHNIALRGDISMTRPWEYGPWIGASSFVMNGYFEQRWMVEYPVGSPPVAIDYKVDAQRVTVIQSGSVLADVLEDDTRLVAGSVTFTQNQPPPYGIFQDAYKFNDFHVRKVADYAAFTEQTWMDGRINVTWNRFSGPGCMDGVYAFNTRKPLSMQLATGLYDSGEIGINGSVVASFYSNLNTPPELPTPANGMLLSMRVRDIGTFNYDVAYWLDAVRPVGQCGP